MGGATVLSPRKHRTLRSLFGKGPVFPSLPGTGLVTSLIGRESTGTGLPAPRGVGEGQSIGVSQQVALVPSAGRAAAPRPLAGPRRQLHHCVPRWPPRRAAAQLALHRPGPGLESRPLAQGPEAAGRALYSPWLG